MQLAAAEAAGHPDAVAAAVVLERDMQRPVHVADPVAEELQGVEALLVAGGRRRQHRQVVVDRREHAAVGQRALVGADPGAVAGQVDVVLVGALPRVVRPRAGVGEVAET